MNLCRGHGKTGRSVHCLLKKQTDLQRTASSESETKCRQTETQGVCCRVRDRLSRVKANCEFPQTPQPCQAGAFDATERKVNFLIWKKILILEKIPSFLLLCFFFSCFFVTLAAKADRSLNEYLVMYLGCYPGKFS